MPSIAIVGAGPSGCYTAQALRKKLPNAEIVVFDRLPVPYGLLRYGVAADHQGTKAVAAQFERLFSRGGVEFRGGVRVGELEDGAYFSIAQLQSVFDAVVLATGIDRDRDLEVPGSELTGVIGSGQLTRALNSHPDESEALPTVGRRVVVVGGGNIAVDIVRLLLRGADEWHGSDMDLQHLQRIVPAAIERIDVAVRADADRARWDAAMIRELGDLGNVRYSMATGILGDIEESRAAAVKDLVEAVHQGEVEVVFHFGVVAESIAADASAHQVQELTLAATDGTKVVLPCDTVVSAIGFEHLEHIPAGVHLAGWLATGPRGTIPQQRTAAQELAVRIIEDLGDTKEVSPKPGLAGLQLESAIDYEAWCRIDALERASADETRVRRKLHTHSGLRAAAAGSGSQGAVTDTSAQGGQKLKETSEETNAKEHASA